MSPQDAFYTLGSIYMALGIVTLLVIIGAIYYVIKKTQEIERNVKVRFEQEIREIKEKPRLLASYIASVVAKGIKNKLNRDA